MNGMALCAGVGGLELGLGLAIRGYRTVVAVERQAYAAACLARSQAATGHRYPIWDDLLAFDARPWRGRTHVLSAGFPCQPFSSAGKQLGKADERWLWPDIERLIEQADPPFVFLENVPGITLHGLDAVLEGLARLGFDAEWGCYSAAGAGAPHLRRRFYLVARRVSHPDSGRLRISPERGAGAAQETDGWHPLTWNMGADTLAHGHGHGREGEWGRRLLDGLGEARGDYADGCGEAVGDTARAGLEGRQRPDNAGQRAPWQAGESVWPPGPSDHAGWSRYGGPEPVLRRGIDGDAAWTYRADRLFHIGNGVVPIVAARAFACLVAPLIGD